MGKNLSTQDIIICTRIPEITPVKSEYFTFHLFLPYCGWQWCVQLNYNSRFLTSYDNVSYSKNTTRAYATHINNNSFILGSTPTKKTLTKFKSVTIQLILNMRLSAVLCLIRSLAIRVLAVPASSAPLQCIFSHYGFLLRSHCTLMSHTLVSN